MTSCPSGCISRTAVKAAVSLAKGKKDYDKRETIKRRETERETRAAIKTHR
jgi:SsrA-binding protein